MNQAVAAVSAPGKVLIAGGYLVLDSAYAGVVLASSARFHAMAQVSSKNHGSTQHSGSFVVKSPQFTDVPSQYYFDMSKTDEMIFSRDEHTKSNKFIELAVYVAICSCKQFLGTVEFKTRLSQIGQCFEIVILGDNDFYYSHFPDGAPPCSSTNGPISKVRKTGLGSSAALTTCIVGSIFRLLLQVGHAQTNNVIPKYDIAEEDYKTLVHSVAQFSHCLAQGKIGSGFDVATAIYGSIRYRRFPEFVLAAFMERCDQDFPTLASWDRLVQQKHESQAVDPLGADIRPFKLPRNISLVLADIAVGSNTPSMVSKVLRWRQENPEQANALWMELDQANAQLLEIFKRLDSICQQSSTAEYDDACILNMQATNHATSGNVGSALADLKYTFKSIRQGMKKMGDLAQVPIEPKEQSALLDACASISGVLGVGVPGAGGYDALFVLYLHVGTVTKADIVLDKLNEQVFSKHTNVTLLPTRISPHGINDISTEVMAGHHPLSTYLDKN